MQEGGRCSPLIRRTLSDKNSRAMIELRSSSRKNTLRVCSERIFRPRRRASNPDYAAIEGCYSSFMSPTTSTPLALPSESLLRVPAPLKEMVNDPCPVLRISGGSSFIHSSCVCLLHITHERSCTVSCLHSTESNWLRVLKSSLEQHPLRDTVRVDRMKIRSVLMFQGKRQGSSLLKKI